ncbi:MAG: S46 family peptidase [Candidatus Eisenbacteria bacterium]|uniref:Dipeptidyl-peptidase n=1 Tax=Eiseniibacteriota bacterium TaxID=2212470 RepID=A0A933WB06_UNCEI|nr:S46 family peptidase [Candidatus Eisenbacteria bacterium]
MLRRLFPAVVLVLVTAVPALADEGMWPFDYPPTDLLQSRYGFTPSREWLEHVQRSVLTTGGGTAAFVSPDGLVLTNHHVAYGQIEKLSSPEHDYVRDGFFARTREEELRCSGLELKLLWETQDVTAQVRALMSGPGTPEVLAAKRKALLTKLESAFAKKTGLRVDTVTLYQGGEYWLYGYRTFDDVRLVCAPDEQAANFGGDPDNFGFPRHDLDFTFYRIYENGKPVRPEHWLRVSEGGVKDGELVLLAGHPGRTNRLRTAAQLEYERDLDRPIRIGLQERRLEVYRRYAALGAEQERRSRNAIRGLENNLKRERGFLALLRDPAFFAGKRAEEDALRARLAKRPELVAKYGDAWDRMAAVQAELRTRARTRSLREIGRVSSLVDVANTLVRLTAEMEKPNEKRFREYQDDQLGVTRFRLFSRAPVYADMEEVVLADQLQMVVDSLGAGDPWVRAALGGRTPAEAAHALLSGTKLADVEERQRLLAGGRKAVEASTDPLIAWARALDPAYREMRAWMEERIESAESVEGLRIAEARFQLDGHASPPDATGTLRLSYGKVAGYPQTESFVPPFTTYYGLFDRAHAFDDRDPFTLPKRIHEAESRLDLATPLNFVTTCESVGGNSGSPFVNRAGELVGLDFDGNIQSFLWTFTTADHQSRSVAVDARGLLEALRKVYDMNALADELTKR